MESALKTEDLRDRRGGATLHRPAGSWRGRLTALRGYLGPLSERAALGARWPAQGGAITSGSQRATEEHHHHGGGGKDLLQQADRDCLGGWSLNPKHDLRHEQHQAKPLGHGTQHRQTFPP